MEQHAAEWGDISAENGTLFAPDCGEKYSYSSYEYYEIPSCSNGYNISQFPGRQFFPDSVRRIRYGIALYVLMICQHAH